MYGFEGEPGREGEGFTRIPESSYRRLSAAMRVALGVTRGAFRVGGSKTFVEKHISPPDVAQLYKSSSSAPMSNPRDRIPFGSSHAHVNDATSSAMWASGLEVGRGVEGRNK